MHKIRLQTKFRRCGHYEDVYLGINGTYCAFDANVDTFYNVNTEAWYNVIFVLCDGYVPQRQLSSVSHGDITRHRVKDSLNTMETVQTTTTVTKQSISASEDSTKTSLRTLRNSRNKGGDTFIYTVAKVEGSITFRNPYGFLPGELYGLLPFEVSLLIKTEN